MKKMLTVIAMMASLCAIADGGKSPKAIFKLNAHAGDICKVPLSDNCSMAFVYCPAGSFKMGYAEAPDVAPLKMVRISRPFWMSKRKVTKRQLLNVGIKSDNKDETAVVWNPKQTIDVISRVMTDKLASILPAGYVVRLATEAEYEYVAKAKAKSGDERLTWGFSKGNVNSPWGVENMFVDKLCFADCLPEIDGIDFKSIEKCGARLCKIDYSQQPKKDPILYCDGTPVRHLRREFSKDASRLKYKLVAEPNGILNGSAFYLVVAPAIDSLAKFPNRQ